MRKTESTVHPVTSCLMDFIPQFILHIDPIVHHTEHEGRRMTENQIKVIMMLHYTREANPGDISDVLNIPKGSLTTVLRSLRQDGFVSRRMTPLDERSYNVMLTDKGSRFVEFHVGKCHEQLDRLFSEMNDSELLAAREGFMHMTQYLERRRTTT
ncbi:MAG: MarR family transcriptional regulator [Spirochaetaceae bacterium]|nr:MarR family transcriptional regulator [Spirochaetaceae bacterium]